MKPNWWLLVGIVVGVCLFFWLTRPRPNTDHVEKTRDVGLHAVRGV